MATKRRSTPQERESLPRRTGIRRPPRHNSTIVTRRKAISCCFRAQAAVRAYIGEVLAEVIDAIHELPLEARPTVLPFLPTVPVRIRLPVIAPGVGIGRFFPELATKGQPATLPLELTRADGPVIERISGLITRLRSPYDCEKCNQPLPQGRFRQQVAAVTPNDVEFTISRRTELNAANRNFEEDRTRKPAAQPGEKRKELSDDPDDEFPDIPRPPRKRGPTRRV